MSKVNHGSKLSVTWTHYVYMLQELLQIMVLLVNTDLDFSLGKNLSVYAAYTLLNQDAISFIIVVNLIVIGIWEGTH